MIVAQIIIAIVIAAVLGAISLELIALRHQISYLQQQVDSIARTINPEPDHFSYTGENAPRLRKRQTNLNPIDEQFRACQR